VNETVPMSEYI